MNKQIWSLLDNLRGPLEPRDYIVQVAACFVWFKQTETQVVDEELRFNYQLAGTELHVLPQKLASAVQVETIFLPECRDKLTGEQIFQLMRSLRELINAKLISYIDLSDILKRMASDLGKFGDAAHVPKELVQLGNSLLGDKVQSVYCPFNTGYFFANALPKQSKTCGEEKVLTDVFFAEVDTFLTDSNFHINQTDCISLPTYIGDGGLEQFQSAIAFPPLNQKYGKLEINDIWGRFPESSLTGDVYHLRHMLAHVSDLVVCFVSNNFLFRTAAGEKHFKQDILEQGLLKAVVALPDGLLSNTMIPVNILVLDKAKTSKEVMFIDASSDKFVEKVSRTRGRLVNAEAIMEAFITENNSEISKLSSIDEVIANEYNLSPSRYILSDEEKRLNDFLSQHDTARLEDVAEIIRPQALKHDDSGSEDYIEFNVSNLNEIGQVGGRGKQVLVNQKDLSRARKQEIQAHDVLVVCKGAVGKVGLVCEEVAENAIASQAFSILRIKPHIAGITPVSLFQYLQSAFGQLQLSSLTTGTSALMLSAKDLSSMPVPLLTESKLQQAQQVRSEVEQAFSEIEQAKAKIKQLNENWL